MSKKDCKMNLDEALINLSKKIPYDEKNYFEEHSHRFQMTVELVLSILKKQGNCKILDVSTYRGHIPILLKMVSDHEIHANEHSEFGKEKLQKDGITLKKWEISTMKAPYESNRFDLVLFNETLEHLIFLPHPVLIEIKRILKTGGFIVLTTPNILALFRRIKFLFGYSPLEPISIEHDGGKLQGHVRIYTMHELKKLFGETNLNYVKSFYYQPPFKIIKKGFFISLWLPIYSLLVKMKPSMSRYLVIVGNNLPKNTDKSGDET